MVGHPVAHLPHIAMIPFENLGVALAGGTVVDDDVFPPILAHSGIIDRFPDISFHIFPTRPEKGENGLGESFFLIAPRFFHRDVSRFLFRSWGRLLDHDGFF